MKKDRWHNDPKYRESLKQAYDRFRERNKASGSRDLKSFVPDALKGLIRPQKVRILHPDGTRAAVTFLFIRAHLKEVLRISDRTLRKWEEDGIYPIYYRNELNSALYTEDQARILLKLHRETADANLHFKNNYIRDQYAERTADWINGVAPDSYRPIQEENNG